MHDDHHEDSIPDGAVNDTIVLYGDQQLSGPNYHDSERGTYVAGSSDGSIQDTIVLYGDQPLSPPSERRPRKRRAIEQAYAVHEDIVPQTIRQIRNKPDHDKWIAACDSEYQSLLKNNT
ncbi:uncharacterized protein V1513DRAFT_468668 [Lipomyces chichibuensis]|uniref:uncharacterized protein n=1 Tax=Lipomyces chichibuensis TaxID=1546026 RepID=UPI0033432801